MTAADRRIGILLTQWGEPEGFHAGYRRDVARRTRGEAAQSPHEAGTASFVGTFPFRSSVGLIPFAVAFPVTGLESAHDSFGFWRRDGADYVNVCQPTLRLPAGRVTGNVIPARESSHRTIRSAWGRSPHDDVDRFAEIVEISQPSGLPDIDEVVYLAALGDEDILFGDIEPRLSEAVRHVNARVGELIQCWFGNRVIVRTGSYADAEPLMAREDLVAAELVEAGIHRLVLARETTDSNSYANDYMTRGFIETALIRLGLADGVQFSQMRQVGRTPEYNHALYQVIRPHLDALPDGSEVAVIYATYGLPFPGADGGGPFSTPHPWVREVYHENAFLNFLSFRRFLLDATSDRLTIHFGAPGVSSERRSDSYLGYAMSLPADFAPMDPASRFRTLRQVIDQAQLDGHREVLIVLSHWIDDNRDTLLALRLMQGTPLNTRAEIRNGKRWIDWTEGACHLTMSAAFDTAAETFAVGYAHRVRGAVEAFGVMPHGVTVVAEAVMTRDHGGRVDVDAGRLSGVSLTVSAPPDPTAPWAFTTETYRVTDDATGAMLSLWDDLPVYLAECDLPLDSLPGQACSPVILTGPYRTIVNQPAVLRLPVFGSRPAGESPVIYLFEHAHDRWERLLDAPGGSSPRYAGGWVEVDINIFGAYVAAWE